MGIPRVSPYNTQNPRLNSASARADLIAKIDQQNQDLYNQIRKIDPIGIGINGGEPFLKSLYDISFKLTALKKKLAAGGDLKSAADELNKISKEGQLNLIKLQGRESAAKIVEYAQAKQNQKFINSDSRLKELHGKIISLGKRFTQLNADQMAEFQKTASLFSRRLQFIAIQSECNSTNLRFRDAIHNNPIFGKHYQTVKIIGQREGDISEYEAHDFYKSVVALNNYLQMIELNEKVVAYNPYIKQSRVLKQQLAKLNGMAEGRIPADKFDLLLSQFKQRLVALRSIDDLKANLAFTRLEHDGTLDRKLTISSVKTNLTLKELGEKTDSIKNRLLFGEQIDLRGYDEIKRDPAISKALADIEFTQKAALFTLNLTIMVLSGGVAAGAGSLVGGFLSNMGRSAIFKGLKAASIFAANSAAFTATHRTLNHHVLGQKPQISFAKDWTHNLPYFAVAAGVSRVWGAAVPQTMNIVWKTAGGMTLEAGALSALSGDMSLENFALMLAIGVGMRAASPLNHVMERTGAKIGLSLKAKAGTWAQSPIRLPEVGLSAFGVGHADQVRFIIETTAKRVAEKVFDGSKQVGLDGRPVDPNNYSEIQSVTEFKHGDILPGSKFQLGRPETYSRELLAVNLKSGEIPQLIGKAKDLVKNHKGDVRHLADKIADLMDSNYSTDQGKGKTGMLMTLGVFKSKGGCCRHRSATLQVLIQAAGIRSRYMRGSVSGGEGNHAWVEVDVKGDGSFSYVIDPNVGIRGTKNSLTMNGRQSFAVANKVVYFPEEKGAVVWRPRSVADANLKFLNGNITSSFDTVFGNTTTIRFVVDTKTGIILRKAKIGDEKSGNIMELEIDILKGIILKAKGDPEVKKAIQHIGPAIEEYNRARTAA